MILSNDVMFNALVNRDSSFEGVFFAAVKTTGIFCRPTCTARKPKKENVEFFKTTHDAILNGYRPCLVCSPLEREGETPNYIKEIIAELNNNPGTSIKDYDLRKKGIEPNKVRRWFKKSHGITFHSYQRMLRINGAFKKLLEGEKVTSVAYDSGYESLSGFTEQFKSIFNVSPSGGKNTNIINIARYESPLGPMFACASETGICLLEFIDRKMLETELKSLTKIYKAVILHSENIHLKKLFVELNEYFEGKRHVFSVPLDAKGTSFQEKVWSKLKSIPYGFTRSYKEQAISIGMPGAIRAVANANGMNRISIVIPCHRVIGDDGNLTGYGGGLWRKKWLLDLEHGIPKDVDQKGQHRMIFTQE